MKLQAEALKKEVDSLRAAKERNEARERELMSSVQDYGEYMRMMSLVKAETEKKVRLLDSERPTYQAISLHVS